jgi:Tol biopolymer transport system component/predicted Ser/Thr protein kinase
MALSVGSRFGPYEVVAPLGKGGMGEVYRALDRKLRREVALKVLPATVSADPERLARFEREAQVLASLNHPNIASVYGVEEGALVMELVEGPDLAERLATARLPVDEAMAIARQIASALEAAHEKGITHRDVKPANVKITPEGVVKVLDFGLAKPDQESAAASGGTDSPTLTISPTRAGMILGTAAYMSPEQVRGAAVDKRSDIWSFGVVLYEMLTGKRLFTGESVSDILAGVLRADPDWSALPADTPARIRKLLRRCLEKDRKQRLQAIGEARIAIDAPEEKAQAFPDSRPLWPWAAALAIALGVAAAGWWRASRPPPPQPPIRLTAELGPGIAMERRGLMALSPDGTRLAFMMRTPDGKGILAVRDLSDGQITRLAGTEGGDGPFFSPDGQWLGFFTPGRLKKIATAGGAVVTVQEFQSLRGAAWGDGYFVATPGVATGLSRIPATGGTAVPLTEINREKGEMAHRWPQLLPGGEAVLFSAYQRTTRYDDSNIEVVSLKTKERKVVYRGGFFARYLPGGFLVFVHQNTLFGAPFDLRHLRLSGEPQPLVQNIGNQSDVGANFTFSENGTFVYAEGVPQPASVFWMESSGKTQPLLTEPQNYGWPRFSPDGQRLVFTVEDSQGRQDIWVRDLKGGTNSRLTALPGFNRSPVWTPDGKNIFFNSWNSNAPGVYVVRSDGTSEPRRLATGNFSPTSTSPDSKWLTGMQPASGTGVGLFKFPIQGDAEHIRLGAAQPVLVTPSITIMPQFSPDGRWLAYSSSEPGREGLWVRPASGGEGEWQVGSAGGRFGFPVWSRNGHELFYLENGRRLMVADYTARGDSFVAGTPRTWTGKPLLYLGSPPIYTYDVSPDGKHVAAVLYSDGTADEKPITQVTFLLNFFDELRRRLGSGK